MQIALLFFFCWNIYEHFSYPCDNSSCLTVQKCGEGASGSDIYVDFNGIGTRCDCKIISHFNGEYIFIFYNQNPAHSACKVEVQYKDFENVLHQMNCSVRPEIQYPNMAVMKTSSATIGMFSNEGENYFPENNGYLFRIQSIEPADTFEIICKSSRVVNSILKVENGKNETEEKEFNSKPKLYVLLATLLSVACFINIVQTLLMIYLKRKLAKRSNQEKTKTVQSNLAVLPHFYSYPDFSTGEENNHRYKSLHDNNRKSGSVHNYVTIID